MTISCPPFVARVLSAKFASCSEGGDAAAALGAIRSDRGGLIAPPKGRWSPTGRLVPSVDAPLQARENFRIVVARSRMLPSVRPLVQRWCAAGLYGSSRTGSRSRGRARSTAEPPGCPSPVSPTVAPYVPSAHPYAVRIVVSLGRRDRSPVDAAFDQQSPDDAGRLVGQSHGDQHLRLASQHPRQPGPLGCATPTGLANHGTGADDQQAPDRPFAG